MSLYRYLLYLYHWHWRWDWRHYVLDCPSASAITTKKSKLDSGMYEHSRMNWKKIQKRLKTNRYYPIFWGRREEFRRRTKTRHCRRTSMQLIRVTIFSLAMSRMPLCLFLCNCLEAWNGPRILSMLFIIKFSKSFSLNWSMINIKLSLLHRVIPVGYNWLVT